MTSLLGGERVPKCDDRVEAYGTVDELSAFMGVLHDVLPESESATKAFLMEVQRNLLTVESVLSCPEEGRIPHLDASALTSLEERTGALEKELPPFRTFILPGGCLAASHCHVCRTVCRRAERAVVKTGFKGIELQYLNRLSDYFFLLARSLSER